MPNSDLALAVCILCHSCAYYTCRFSRQLCHILFLSLTGVFFSLSLFHFIATLSFVSFSLQLVEMAGLDLVVSVNVSVYTVQCVTLFMVTVTAVLYKATVEHTVSMVSVHGHKRNT